MADSTDIKRGTIALDLSDEFPGLELHYRILPGGDGKTPRVVKRRLAVLSDRFRVAQAPALRQTGVPSAYRAFYRQVGVDPDIVQSPLDAAIMQRLRDGAFLAKGLLYDAIAIAALETLVPIWVMDAHGILGGLGIRPAEKDEQVEGPNGDLLDIGQGQLVIADANGPITALLAPPGPSRIVTKQSQSMLLYCLRVEGVPQMTVAEALNLTATMIREG